MTDDNGSIAEGIAEVEEQMTALARRIRATTRESATAVHPELAPFGYKMLRVIRRCGAAHASAVADTLGVDRSVVSRHLRQLQDLGLVEVRADEQDGRARLLALTPAGAQRVEADGEQGGSRLMRVLGAWTRDDLDAFAGFLARLNDTADADGSVDSACPAVGAKPLPTPDKGRAPAHAG